MKKIRTIATASFAAAALAMPAKAVTIASVGTYDENTTQTNTVDNITSGDTDQNLTSTSFTPLVLAAFNANTGGVANFDDVTGNLLTNGSFDVTYGTSQAKTLKVTVVGPTTLTAEANSIPISGLQHFGVSQSNFTFNFSETLSAFGITILQRTGTRNLALTFTLEDATTVEISGAEGDTFFGYQAAVGNGIVSASFVPSNTQHYDDMGFIVVPEPSAAIMLLGGAGTLLIRRRRRA